MGAELNTPSTLDELFGKPFHDWLRRSSQSKKEEVETRALKIKQQEAQGATLFSGKSRSFLEMLAEHTVLEPGRLEEIATRFEDWDAIYNVVRAGWAQSYSGGIIITQPGKDIAKTIFRPKKDSPTAP